MLRAAANYPVQGSGFHYYSKSGYTAISHLSEEW